MWKHVNVSWMLDDFIKTDENELGQKKSSARCLISDCAVGELKRL